MRRGPSTVAELSAALGLTHNAIRVHLATLERDGLARDAGKRPGTRKPEGLFALTDDAEQYFPKAYDVILNRLLHALGETLSPDELERVLREVGKALAAEPSATELTTPGDRAERAAALIGDLGGLAEVVATEDGYVLHGFSCPLHAVVVDHRLACRLTESLLTEAIGVPVRESCSRHGTPRCRFTLSQ
jgi:predicted ArsR family transcriptional regulator